MAVPSLVPHNSLPAGFPFAGSLFAVARGGEFAGRRFVEGELALVSGAPVDGDRVVLVARGPGRPRLGAVRGRQLLGDRGEPCHTSRWEVAGKLLGVVRPVGTGWVVEHLDTPGLVGMAPSAGVGLGSPSSVDGTPERQVRRAPQPARPVGQLSLFAA